MPVPMQSEPILQKHVPHLPWRTPGSNRLPGVQPLGSEDWIRIDEVYAEQMRLREQLLTQNRPLVVMLDQAAEDAAGLLLDDVLKQLARTKGFEIAGNCVRCPDNRQVNFDRSDPLGAVGRLIQEDVCLLQKCADEHVLVGAVLCFPAGWTLAEKFGRPLGRIHAPVDQYDAVMARRVQRLFDAVRPKQVLWRSNALSYHDPWLFQPRKEADGQRTESDAARYLRSEFQTVRLLGDGQTVAFSIHTYVIATADLSAADKIALSE